MEIVAGLVVRVLSGSLEQNALKKLFFDQPADYPASMI
jgi:hypothetical protein